jgi:hypothetical protein
MYPLGVSESHKKGQAVGGVWDMTDLIGGAGQRAARFIFTL